MDNILIDVLQEYGLKRRHLLTIMSGGIRTIGDLRRLLEKHDDPITALLHVPRVGGAIAYHVWKAYQKFLKAMGEEVKV